MADGSMNFMVVDPPDVELAVENGSSMESIIKLSNVSDDEIIFFKIRSTDPCKYCVQPSRGVIWPKCSTMVTITCPDLPNLLEVGISDDVFAIHSFQLKFADVALRNTNVDASTAYVEFQKQYPKLTINELRLKVSFIADRPISYTQEYLVAELETTTQGRKKLEEELLMLRAQNEAMSLHLNPMQTNLIICNEGKESFKKERDNQRVLFGLILILLAITVSCYLKV